jgi:uncharacterized membrane protein YecN with MAPEG domain
MDVVFTAYFLVHLIVGHTLVLGRMNHAVGTSSSEKAFWRHFEKCHHFDFMMTVHDDATHDDGGMVVMASGPSIQ